jgi:hypothetical protein
MENQENQLNQKEKIKNLPFKFLVIRRLNGEYVCRLVYDNKQCKQMFFEGETIKRASFPEIAGSLYLRGDEYEYSHAPFYSTDYAVNRWKNFLCEKQDVLFNNL